MRLIRTTIRKQSESRDKEKGVGSVVHVLGGSILWPLSTIIQPQIKASTVQQHGTNYSTKSETHIGTPYSGDMMPCSAR